MVFFCEMVILVIFKGFLLVKNLKILIQIVPDRSIYYYLCFVKIFDSFIPVIILKYVHFNLPFYLEHILY